MAKIPPTSDDVERMMQESNRLDPSKGPSDPYKQYLITSIHFFRDPNKVVFVGSGLNGERKFQLAVDATDEENLQLYPCGKEF